MTARKLSLATAVLASSLAVAAPAAHAGLLDDTLESTTDSLLDSGGQLLGTLDPVTGTITDELGNVIGTITPGGGEGGTAPGAPGTPDAPTGGTFGGSPLDLALSASRSQRFTSVARRGLSARTTCSATCGVLAALVVDRRTAKRLGLGNGSRQAVVGTAVTPAGRLPIRLSSRARRALSRALPTTRTRKSVRAKRIRAKRVYRSRNASTARRRAARRSYLRYRRIERSWARGGRVNVTVAAVGMDTNGRTTTIRSRRLVIKR